MLRPALNLALGYTRQWLNRWGIHLELKSGPGTSFWIMRLPCARHFADSLSDYVGPDLVIANPPYFKIAKSDPRVAVMSRAWATQHLHAVLWPPPPRCYEPNGQLVFITPRSFCSGTYFKQFRKWFFQNVCIARLHAFASRTEAFSRDEVLQENVIFKACKAVAQSTTVDISSSYGMSDLENTLLRSVPLSEVLDIDSAEAMLSIPVDPADSQTRHIFSQWSKRLRSLGLEISTGPVVPFRTSRLLMRAITSLPRAVSLGAACTAHGNHLAARAFHKPQRIYVSPDTYPAFAQSELCFDSAL